MRLLTSGIFHPKNLSSSLIHTLTGLENKVDLPEIFQFEAYSAYYQTMRKQLFCQASAIKDYVPDFWVQKFSHSSEFEIMPL